MNKKIFLFLFLGIFLVIPMVSSAKTVETNIGSEGLQIFYPQFDFVKQNLGFDLHIHTSNISNGFPLYNTEYECNLHLYNSSGMHTFEGALENNGNQWDKELEINSGNFSDLGIHAFYIWCNNSYLGGEARGTFEVTLTGHEFTTPEAILDLGYTLFILILFFIILWFMLSLPSVNEIKDTGEIVNRQWVAYLKPVLFFIAWALLIAFFFVASNIALAYLYSTLLGDTLFLIYQIMFRATLPILVIYLVWIFVSIFQHKEMKKIIERGGDDFGSI